MENIYKRPESDSGIVTINGLQAKEIVLNHSSLTNRKTGNKNLQGIKKVMETGRFPVTQIIFDENGVLRDGHHRLTVHGEHFPDLEIKYSVLYGQPPSDVKYYDINKKRSSFDFITMKLKERNPNHTSEFFKLSKEFIEYYTRYLSKDSEKRTVKYHHTMTGSGGFTSDNDELEKILNEIGYETLESVVNRFIELRKADNFIDRLFSSDSGRGHRALIAFALASLYHNLYFGSFFIFSIASNYVSPISSHIMLKGRIAEDNSLKQYEIFDTTRVAIEKIRKGDSDESHKKFESDLWLIWSTSYNAAWDSYNWSTSRVTSFMRTKSLRGSLFGKMNEQGFFSTANLGLPKIA